MKRTILGIFLTSFLFTFSAAAQTGTTSLRGTVLDRTGGVVRGAKVTLSNQVRGVERTITTSDTGAYQFISMPPGTYSLIVEKTGFRNYKEDSLQLLVDSASTVNVSLELGSTNDTIEVTAQAETLNTSNASLGIAFNENQLKQLPLEGRNVPIYSRCSRVLPTQEIGATLTETWIPEAEP